MKRLLNTRLARPAALVLLLTLVLALGSAGTTWAHRASSSQPAQGGRPPSSTVPPRLADLSIDKSGVWTGETIDFTLVVTNAGPIVASDVFVADRFPATVTIDTYTTTKGFCFVNRGTLACDLGALAANEVVRIDVRTRVARSSVRNVANVALVAGTTRETSYDNNVDNVVVERP